MTRLETIPAGSGLHHGDCLPWLRGLESGCVQLVVTSPPYNIGKSYEKRKSLADYVEWQAAVIGECARVLSDKGSICWQVGNFVDDGSIVPLDIALYPIFAKLGLVLRNRIVWHFEHGLHCKRRFSGRYETIMWFTKGDEYHFDLDPVRVPQKYPGKRYFKGPRAGEYSCNPLGKNPGDLWVIPNVKSNHVEKTTHPCQFPLELVERLVLSMSRPGDLVVDPFAGVGTTLAAALRNGRRAMGAELNADYVAIARRRMQEAVNGSLRAREMNTPVFDPDKAGESLRTAPWLPRKRRPKGTDQMDLIDDAGVAGDTP